MLYSDWRGACDCDRICISVCELYLWWPLLVCSLCHMKVSILNKDLQNSACHCRVWRLASSVYSSSRSSSSNAAAATAAAVTAARGATSSHYTHCRLTMWESSMFSNWKVIDIICTQCAHEANIHICTGSVRFGLGRTTSPVRRLKHNERVRKIAERAQYSNNKNSSYGFFCA